jgi:hypothetical protein
MGGFTSQRERERVTVNAHAHSLLSAPPITGSVLGGDERGPLTWCGASKHADSWCRTRTTVAVDCN